MKTNICYVFATIIISFIVFITGCAITPSTTTIVPPKIKTFTDQAIWPKTTKDKVYTACMTALHMTEFEIHPSGANKEDGIISPKLVFVYPKTQYTSIYYKLQILILEVPDNKVMVDIKIKVGGKLSSEYNPIMVQYMRHICSNRVADDLEKFFAQLNVLLGKADYYRDDSFIGWD